MDSKFDPNATYQIVNTTNISQQLGHFGWLHSIATDARQVLTLAGSDLQGVEHLIGEGVYEIKVWSEDAGEWVAHEAKSLVGHNQNTVDQAKAEANSLVDHNKTVINEGAADVENAGSVIANEGSVIASHNTAGVINQAGTVIEKTGTTIENVGSDVANQTSTATATATVTTTPTPPTPPTPPPTMPEKLVIREN